MALKSTVYKADLHISNLNTHYYQQHLLTLAKHPSETDERLMIRVLSFVLYAQEGLQFGKGVSEEQEPALWQKNLTGEIELWIDIGLPDAKRVRKVSGFAKEVVIIIYGKRNIEQWLTENEETFKKRNNITVLLLETLKTQELAALASRTMFLNCLIEGAQISLISETLTVTLEPRILHQ